MFVPLPDGTIRKVPCLDLGIKQLRRVGEDGETARRSEKEAKPCGNCRDLFCSRWGPSSCWHKAHLCCVSVLPDHLLQGLETLAGGRKLVRQKHFAPHHSRETLEGASDC